MKSTTYQYTLTGLKNFIYIRHFCLPLLRGMYFTETPTPISGTRHNGAPHPFISAINRNKSV